MVGGSKPHPDEDQQAFSPIPQYLTPFVGSHLVLQMTSLHGPKDHVENEQQPLNKAPAAQSLPSFMSVGHSNSPSCLPLNFSWLLPLEQMCELKKQSPKRQTSVK